MHDQTSHQSIHARGYIVHHDAQPSMQPFQLSRRPGLHNIEQTKQRKSQQSMPDLHRAHHQRDPLPCHLVDHYMSRGLRARSRAPQWSRRYADQSRRNRRNSGRDGKTYCVQMRRARREEPQGRRGQRGPCSRPRSDQTDPEECPRRPGPECSFSGLSRHRPCGARFPDSVPQAPRDRVSARRSGSPRSPTCPDRSPGSGRCRRGRTHPRPLPPSCRSDISTQPVACSRLLSGRRNHPRHHVVVVRLGDLAAIKAPRVQLIEGPEIVDIDLAVNLRRVELRPALPQQRCLLRFAFHQHIQLAPRPGGSFSRG